MEEVLERLGIIYGVTVLVVIEVSVNVRKVGCPALDPIRPISQQRVAIVPLVFSGCAMEPDIGEICGQLNGRLRSAPIVNTKSNLVPPKQVENGWGSSHHETRTRTDVLWAVPEENPPASRDLHATGAEAERGSVLAWTSAIPLSKRTAK